MLDAKVSTKQLQLFSELLAKVKGYIKQKISEAVDALSKQFLDKMKLEMH